MKKAFTLVELLIVIALIAILSVAVLATINPIEQSNKARDAAQKNDAAEVLAAYERYYTSQNKYPWGQPSVIGDTVFPSNDVNFGVTDGAGGDGELIITSELKSSFAAKTPFTTTPSPIDMMYVYSDGLDSNYVCFVPKAKANRSIAGMLRCIAPITASGGGLIAPGQDSCVNVDPSDSAWTQTTTYESATQAFFMCVPESAAVTPVYVGSTAVGTT